MAIQIEKVHHNPVMLNEVLSALDCKPITGPPDSEKVYIDCTLGMGGHTEAILKATAPYGKVIGIDRDRDALRIAEERLHGFANRLILRKGSFCEMFSIIADLGYTEVNGILFDLGVSSYHLDTAERGFSFQKPGPLDMRMDSESGETAADLVNRLTQPELADIIKKLGEERWANRISSSIIRFRTEEREITRTEELEGIIWRAVPARFRHGRIHPATRTFQALRMAVNQEIEQIEAGLAAAISLINHGGRVVVLAFHSLEDRCIKQTFKKWEKGERILSDKHFINLYKKPIMACPEEVSGNRRARSAKLRALKRAA